MEKNIPTKEGWFWVWFDEDYGPFPCWFVLSEKCFLPAGLGDVSRDGVYLQDVYVVGEEIQEPKIAV